MSTILPPTELPPADDILAGEYVLGVLDADTRRQVESRIDREPGFAALVATWQSHFERWLLMPLPVQPSAHLWPNIRRQLGWPAVESVDAKPGLWDSVGFWRGATGLALAASVAAIAFGLRRPEPAPLPPPPVVVEQPTPSPTDVPRPVTVLADDAGRTGWVASFSGDRSRVEMMPVPGDALPQGEAHELWLIPEGQAPRSLGVVSGDQRHSIDIPDALQAEIAAGAILAITVEPAASIPHAAPTGPIVAKGVVARI